MNETQKRRPIRSYVLRTGRMTPGQQRAYEENWGRWGLEHRDELLDFEATFGRPGERVLEIGFGMGQSLVDMAAAAPQRNFIGIEVHKPGVGRLLHAMAERDVDNIRVYCHDAVEVLRDCIPDGSLDTIQIFFPDPWHKKRHHKRRIVNQGFRDLLVRLLKPGGVIHMATDWQDYAESMAEQFLGDSRFVNRGDTEGYAEKPAYRPLTRFEQRGLRLGHGVWDLVFARA